MRATLAIALLGAACGRLDFGRVPVDGALTTDGASDASGDAPGGQACASTETTLPWTTTFDTQPAWANPYGSGVQIVNGGLEITPPPNTGMQTTYGGYIDASSTDHRGQRMFIEVARVLDALPFTQVLFRFTITDNMLQIFWDKTDIYFEEVIGGTSTSSSAVYDAATDRWWQLREAAGTFYFETSSNGVDWVLRYQRSTPAFLANSYIEFAAGYYQAQTMSVGTARFDNLVVCGP